MGRIQREKATRAYFVICALSLIALIITTTITTLVFAQSDPKAESQTSSSINNSEPVISSDDHVQYDTTESSDIVASLDVANIENNSLDSLAFTASSTSSTEETFNESFFKNAIKIAGIAFSVIFICVVSYFFFFRRPQYSTRPPKTRFAFSRRTNAAKNPDIIINGEHKTQE